MNAGTVETPIVLAKIGDVIETSVRSPVPRVIRLKLQTLEACAMGNNLLMDSQSGWSLSQAGVVNSPLIERLDLT